MRIRIIMKTYLQFLVFIDFEDVYYTVSSHEDFVSFNDGSMNGTMAFMKARRKNLFPFPCLLGDNAIRIHVGYQFL